MDAGQGKSLPARDPLLVLSVEKAFRVLHLFDGSRPGLTLSQIAEFAGLDMSAAQRFTHTLTTLGYIRRVPETKRFELTIKVLELGCHYLQASELVERSMPYLLHLSKTTEETVNLTVLDKESLIVVSRFLSRHVLNNDLMIGAELPVYCTAPGVAILSVMSATEADAVLDRLDVRPYTLHTVCDRDGLRAKLDRSSDQGYATSFEEYRYGDLSVAAPIIDVSGRPFAAINIAVSRSRCSPEEAEARFAPLVTAAARSISQAAAPKNR